MRTQFSIWAVGVLLAALLVAGCGDSSSGSDGDGAVTKKSFLKQANAICAKQKQKNQASAQSDDAVKASEEAAEGSVEALKVEMREIEAIGIPDGDQQEIESILKNVRKTIELAEPGSNNDLIAANESLLLAEKQADKYGLKECFLQ